ncbi:MAG: hypothetical protein KDD44_06235, partial [Bdellovibrionales bacterium]|nr:hypothetical protein [Bdellovibrionales bacterium]
HSGVAGDLDGRMVYYKTDGSGGYEFAFAMPFSNGRKGPQFVPFNTFQPSFNISELSNAVANWIQVTNGGTSDESGDLIFYQMDGSVLGIQKVTIPGGARRDFAGHQWGTNMVGVVEWRPEDSAIPFLVRNVRYYYDSASFASTSFATASQFQGMSGSGAVLSAPLDTNGSSAILELSNVQSQANNVTVSIYASGGQLLSQQVLTLGPMQSQHIIADGILNGQKGLAVIQGSLSGGVLALAMHYGRDSQGKLLYMYGVPAKEALGSVLRGSYNTFLSQGCRLHLGNATATAQPVNVHLRRYDGTEPLGGSGIDLTVAAHGMLDLNLCAQDVSDAYGVVTVQPQVANSVTGTIVRVGANNQYRFPTELR